MTFALTRRLRISCIAMLFGGFPFLSAYASNQVSSAPPPHLADTLRRVMESTVKITTRAGQMDRCTGTGFLVAIDTTSARRTCFLITAAHVLEAVKQDSVVIVFHTANQSADFERTPISLCIRQKNGSPYWDKHPQEDIAAIKISLAREALPRPLTEQALASSTDLDECDIDLGSEVFCFGYPHHLEAETAGFPVLRSGRIASYSMKEADRFAVDINTYGGDSGGPVVFIGSSSRSLSRPCFLVLGILSKGQDSTGSDNAPMNSPSYFVSSSIILDFLHGLH